MRKATNCNREDIMVPKQENRTLMLIAGAGAGAGVMYLLDPDRGRRRRALVRDKMVRAANVTGEALEATWRDARNRAEGWTSMARSSVSSHTPTERELINRVRSKLGYLVSHPRAIEVHADASRQGRIILSGPVLTDEVDRLISGIRRIRGVQDVDDQLERHDEPGTIPGLQGRPWRRSGPRMELMQAHWSPSARMAVGCLGAGLAWYGASRRNVPGKAVLLLGTALLVRALTNLEVARLTGIGAGRRAIDIRKTRTIAAPVDRVFDFWRNYENFPQFMKRIREVRRSGNGRSRWTLAGPAGAHLSWDATVTEYAPNQVLAWKTEPGSLVDHAGVVRFTDNGNGTTTIHVQMTYNPLAGAVAHSFASLLGTDPESLMEEELARMKTVLESGSAPHPVPPQTDEAERTEA